MRKGTHASMLCVMNLMHFEWSQLPPAYEINFRLVRHTDLAYIMSVGSPKKFAFKRRNGNSKPD
jgi:hypothetical protein